MGSAGMGKKRKRFSSVVTKLMKTQWCLELGGAGHVKIIKHFFPEGK